VICWGDVQATRKPLDDLARGATDACLNATNRRRGATNLLGEPRLSHVEGFASLLQPAPERNLLIDMIHGLLLPRHASDSGGAYSALLVMFLDRS
jgi:hypothetical protein